MKWDSFDTNVVLGDTLAIPSDTKRFSVDFHKPFGFQDERRVAQVF
jgi:hypothetical protein